MCRANRLKSLYGVFIFICAMCLLYAFPSAANAVSLADIAGTWSVSGVASGPGAPYWGRGTMTVNQDGTFTITDEEDDGSLHNTSGRLSISSKGIKSTSNPNLLCQIDLGNTVMACTETWSDGSTNLILFTKQAASYSIDDLSGYWEANGLDCGPTNPSWQRVGETIGSAGNFQGSYSDSNGATGSISGQVSLSATGEATCSSGFCPDQNLMSYMDASKSVVVGTDGVSPTTPDAVLTVFTKMAPSGSYSMADLTGTWHGNGLASGAFAPWWERNTASIHPDGTYTGSYTGSDRSAGRTTGTLSISPDGMISCISGDCLHYSGVMDADKTVIVLTGTWSSGTTEEIYIFTKSAGLPGVPTGVSAVPGNGRAAVSFTLPAANGRAITKYTVTSDPGGITAKGRKSPIVVRRLANGTSYTFIVTATNKIGTGPPSDSSNSVTPAKLPGVPTNVVAVAGDSQATVSFHLPSSDGGSAITQYTVKSRPGGITSTGAGSPIVVTGLTDGTRYKFTVTATNEIGTGRASKPSNSVKPISALVGF